MYTSFFGVFMDYDSQLVSGIPSLINFLKIRILSFNIYLNIILLLLYHLGF
jgi:hypothetical protein